MKTVDFRTLVRVVAGMVVSLGGTPGCHEDETITPTIVSPRQRLPFNEGWRFTLGDPPGTTGLAYEDAKAWVLPTGNAFLSDPANHAVRPDEDLGDGVPYVSEAFDDSGWQAVNLPHDYAIAGPYANAISSNMGRLPSVGVAWYRKTFVIAEADAGKSVFLEIDGAMSYSMVWLNGQFVGGWPYGYSSYRLDLTEAIVAGRDNVVAIRLDNPVPADAQWDSGSSRWYPGAGIYRNVRLVIAEPIHVAQWGTHVTIPVVDAAEATVDLRVNVDNDASEDALVTVTTDVYRLDPAGNLTGRIVTSFDPVDGMVPTGGSVVLDTHGTLRHPELWGTPPEQTPNLYQAVTYVLRDDVVVDVEQTTFGVRTIAFDPDEGFLLNGQHVKIDGVCLHHDLGPLGAAFNLRARQRQLELLAEMGSNAIRTAHNPPEPELLELADRMGFLVMDEAFDVWAEGKTALDHHLLFPEWHEQDLRALIRRDRNHPSVIMWSIGNEVIEQYDNVAGPEIGRELTAIAHAEDPTRPTVAGMNAASPTSPFPESIDAIGLNYQGTGVRGGPAQYPEFHERFPDKFVIGTETTSTFSTRGTYLFPVSDGRGEPANGSGGVRPLDGVISSYDLYFADWSYSPDAEFESQDRYPFVGGEFVWTGFDYLGEPTPLDSVANSSYFGIIDLAGFKKDRFYLYQSRWRPELPMAHILPHWTWPDRDGQVTPIHVYTSGDSAELFLNGASLGMRTKEAYDYRLRWDDVVYEPGELRVVAFKEGREWATDTVRTAGEATKLSLAADRSEIVSDGNDLSFVTLTVLDEDGQMVRDASHPIRFAVTEPGEIVATANGHPKNTTVYSSVDRNAFNGMALAIVRSRAAETGTITMTATAEGLVDATIEIAARFR